MGFRKVLNDKTPLICAILWVANMGGDISSPALTKRDRLTVASMARRGGVTDFLCLPFVRFRVQRPAARFFTFPALMPKSD
jgi:hypothetical protein